MKSVALHKLLWTSAVAVALALVLAAWHDPHLTVELANPLWACF